MVSYSTTDVKKMVFRLPKILAKQFSWIYKYDKKFQHNPRVQYFNPIRQLLVFHCSVELGQVKTLMIFELMRVECTVHVILMFQAFV